MSGNHEGRSAFYEDFKADMEKHHVTVLENERYFLKKRWRRNHGSSVRDPRFVRDDWAEKELPKEVWEEAALKEALDDATANLSPDYFTILLAHRPEFGHYTKPIQLI